MSIVGPMSDSDTRASALSAFVSTSELISNVADFVYLDNEDFTLVNMALVNRYWRTSVALRLKAAERRLDVVLGAHALNALTKRQKRLVREVHVSNVEIDLPDMRGAQVWTAFDDLLQDCVNAESFHVVQTSLGNHAESYPTQEFCCIYGDLTFHRLRFLSITCPTETYPELPLRPHFPALEAVSVILLSQLKDGDLHLPLGPFAADFEDVARTLRKMYGGVPSLTLQVVSEPLPRSLTPSAQSPVYPLLHLQLDATLVGRHKGWAGVARERNTEPWTFSAGSAIAFASDEREIGLSKWRSPAGRSTAERLVLNEITIWLGRNLQYVTSIAITLSEIPPPPGEDRASAAFLKRFVPDVRIMKAWTTGIVNNSARDLKDVRFTVRALPEEQQQSEDEEVAAPAIASRVIWDWQGRAFPQGNFHKEVEQIRMDIEAPYLT